MSTKKGLEGEDIACKILSNIAFEILDRNYRSSYGEIDIIALKNQEMHFIEVKTTYGPYNPAENFHARKLRRFCKTVQVYCYRHAIDENMVRIDLALVDMKNRKFTFVPDANNYFY